MPRDVVDADVYVELLSCLKNLLRFIELAFDLRGDSYRSGSGGGQEFNRLLYPIMHPTRATDDRLMDRAKELPEHIFDAISRSLYFGAQRSIGMPEGYVELDASRVDRLRKAIALMEVWMDQKACSDKPIRTMAEPEAVSFDASEFLKDNPMKRDHLRVLYLLSVAGQPLTQLQIAQSQDMPKERALSSILARFRKLDLSCRPLGKKCGEVATDRGRAVISSLSEDCRKIAGLPPIN